MKDNKEVQGPVTVPEICVPIVSPELDALIDECLRAARLPCSIIEWRADLFEGAEDRDTVIRKLRPLIGGRKLMFTYPWLRRLPAEPVDIVDIGFGVDGVTSIASYHDFDGVPDDEDLESITEGFERTRPDMIKLAVTPQSEEDLQRFLNFARGFESLRIIPIAMGELGRETRIRGAGFGMPITYAYGDKPTAKGQYSAEEAYGLICQYYADML